MFRTPSKRYWDGNWQGAQPAGSLSSLNIFNFDLKRLFRSLELPAHARVAELGFAPGKTLAWIYDNIVANVVGVDYSSSGCEVARKFYADTERVIEVICEDATAVESLDGCMDLVYSIGVLEHFEEPAGLLSSHLRWLNETGTALVLIPNYSGVYRSIQGRLDPRNLEIHNLDVMSPDYWLGLRGSFPEFELTARYFGHPSPWLLSLQKYGRMGMLVQYAFNFLAFFFPVGTRLSSSILVTGRRRSVR